MAPDDPLPPLSLAELETLLAALDPRLDGFGEGESCLDDALAYLARLGIPQSDQGEAPALIRWLEGWRAAGGDRRTLRLMVATLLSSGAIRGKADWRDLGSGLIEAEGLRQEAMLPGELRGAAGEIRPGRSAPTEG